MEQTVASNAEKKQSSGKHVSTSTMFEWLESMAFAVCIILIVMVFFFSVSRISGNSMYPTLRDGDQVLLRVVDYTPQRGNVITTDGLIAYGKPLVKRIIGVEGDSVDIDFKTGHVYVNGEVLKERYISSPSYQDCDVSFPYTVPAGTVFVMGDNRAYSLDSRWQEVGPIDVRDILGQVIQRISPSARMIR